MTDSLTELPATDGHVHVQLLNGGSMLAEYHKLHKGDPAEKFRMYNWAFFIRHAEYGRKIIWDLGMSSLKIPDDYPPVISNGMWNEAQVEGPHETIAAQIERRNGVTSAEIDTVLMSHAHFDHCRPVSETFPNATVYFGPGTLEHCAPGHFAKPSSMWDGRFFDPEKATENWKTLEGPWEHFGPFENAMDLFGDGSFWIIQAPGHMPGNLGACARLATGDWIVLGSDCCHSRALFVGTKEFASFQLPDGETFSLHKDLLAAKDTLDRMRIMERRYKAHVALAHDTAWMEKEDDPVLLSLLDDDFRRDMRMALKHQAPF
ncbi:hypothetical protein N7494_000267 [Penicillium frequentans]|uniref:Metallo-beta-lactamase domain-containing protein n=1 Tax=Penicillium frequentans TaxID=3151616 RepID=A0AAD6GLF0_9EURO|nr:hypothetical protein N7494_000267 [Penicillium glabrum]